MQSCGPSGHKNVSQCSFRSIFGLATSASECIKKLRNIFFVWWGRLEMCTQMKGSHASDKIAKLGLIDLIKEMWSYKHLHFFGPSTRIVVIDFPNLSCEPKMRPAELQTTLLKPANACFIVLNGAKNRTSFIGSAYVVMCVVSMRTHDPIKHNTA